ncbi:MAG: transglutaminase-like cysteine peptidase [Erythrobacter sp.]
MERSENFRTSLRCAAAGLALVGLGIAAPAQAQSAAPLLVPAMTSALAKAACPVGDPSIRPTRGPQLSSPVSTSKSAAILGGATSALEQIRAQQASFDSLGSLMPQAGPAMEPAIAQNFEPLAPASAAFASVAPCAGSFDLGETKLVEFTRAVPLPGHSRDDFLSSRKVALGRTSFDASWSRVSREKPRAGQVPREVITPGADVETKLDKVNRWVNHAIAYTDDRKLFGKADYWAGARQTLQLGKGDCEDYAILKMHLLAQAGVRREDMFLTIARDLVRRADHAVLIVRTPDGYRMLDNATDTVLDATLANDYLPVLSFNGRRTWLHGS